MDKKKIFKFVLLYLALIGVAFVAYYVTLPALNAQSPGFWSFLCFLLLLFLWPVAGVRMKIEVLAKGEKKPEKAPLAKKNLILLIAAVPLLVMIVGNIISSTFFCAKSYASVISVQDAVFSEDLPETENVTNIALMDSDTAAIVGNRTLGSLSEVVSQYVIAPSYTQINYHGTPKKVANLEYAGFFKWLGNRDAGIPGYVMVDPVNNTAEYCALSSPLRYSESGLFGDDLLRRIRFDYPTKILGTPRFELNEDGAPVYVVPCLTPRVMMFGASDVTEVIIFDPTNGNSEILSAENTPSWVDVVYDGDLAMEKYNWKGTLSGGFWNSVIGNKDCKQTTDDYSYIVIGDDVWYFTGVTSVNSDRSNIGFIITNARTGEYKFYPVIGAEEHSAMSAAQGEVQEKGYVASFPALINVKGEATYIMVLKDAGGLVKLYAMVNVEQYNLVATGETQEAAKRAYVALLTAEGVLNEELPPPAPDVATETLTITLDAITPVTANGETVLYLRGVTADGTTVLLKRPAAEDERLLFLKAGDGITVTATLTDTEGVYTLLTWQRNETP